MKHTLKIGDILYNCKLQEYKVSKIGNKYFECENHSGKFNIETLRFHSPNYSQFEFRLYADKQHILDEKEYDKLKIEVRQFFNSYGKIDISLEKLRKISEIINS